MSTPTRADDGAWQDHNGCLTAAGLSALRSSVTGQAPTALAAHLAGCARCQDRVLAVDAPRPRSGRRAPRAVAPSRGRLLLLVGLVLAAILAALATLRQLVGGS